jgi:hypothetical protein
VRTNRAFISYKNPENALEARALARALARSGVRPWQDERELGVGRQIRSEIEAAIRHQCRGGLVWLSREAIASAFIKNIELPEMLSRAEGGDFPLVPIFAGMTPSEADELLAEAGVKLSPYKGVVVQSEQDLTSQIRAAVIDYVRSHLQVMRGSERPVVRAITRYDSAAGAQEAVLDFDWREAYEAELPDPLTQLELSSSLEGAFSHLLEVFGPGDVLVDLKTHLSVAVAIGYALRRPSGAVPVGTHEGMAWRGGLTAADSVHGLQMTRNDGPPDADDLALEVSVSRSVRPGVDDLVARRNRAFRARVHFQPEAGPSQHALTSSEAANMWAEQIVTGASQLRDEVRARNISLFIAAPAPLAVLIGWRMNAVGTTVIYEWEGNTGPYVPAWSLP